MWVEFVVGSRPCYERFFSRYSGFPLSSKTNISKFQFDLDYCQALYHEPLAREIAQALPVLLTLNKLQLQNKLHFTGKCNIFVKRQLWTPLPNVMYEFKGCSLEHCLNHFPNKRKNTFMSNVQNEKINKENLKKISHFSYILGIPLYYGLICRCQLVNHVSYRRGGGGFQLCFLCADLSKICLVSKFCTN